MPQLLVPGRLIAASDDGVLLSGTDLQRILALSPSLLVWPALATMTQATDGTGAAPLSGDPVGRVQDLSGNGNNLIAGTWASPSNAARGTFQNNAINFDAVNDYYSLLNAINITESMTVVRAFKRASAGIRSLGIAGNGAGGTPYDIDWGTDNILRSRIPSGGASTANTNTGSFVGTISRNSSASSLRLNAAEVLSSSPGTAADNFTVVGARAAGTVYNSGEISFLAVFPTELTGANLALVEQIAAATNGAVLA